MANPTDEKETTAEERVAEKAHNTFAAHIRGRRNRAIKRRKQREREERQKKGEVDD